MSAYERSKREKNLSTKQPTVTDFLKGIIGSIRHEWFDRTIILNEHHSGNCRARIGLMSDKQISGKFWFRGAQIFCSRGNRPRSGRVMLAMESHVTKDVAILTLAQSRRS
jgi:hypothetical protein